MKSFLLSLCCTLTLSSFAQITFEQAYPIDPVSKFDGQRVVRLENVDTKLLVITSTQIHLYNNDYSLFKSMLIPLSSIPGGAKFNIYYGSNALFNTDPTDFEFLINYVNGSVTGTIVTDESGATLLNIKCPRLQGDLSIRDRANF